MPPLPDDHACAFKDEADRLRSEVEGMHGAMATMRAELDALKQRVFGKKAEKVTPVEREVRTLRPTDPERAKQKRAERALLKEHLEEDIVEHRVPTEAKTCPECHAAADRTLAAKESIEYAYVPGHFRRRVHRRETLACRCGQHIVTARAPARVGDKTAYGAGFVAHVVVSKCADSIPLARMERHYARLGIPIARSTLCDLFHRAAGVLSPLAKRILVRIAQSDVVWADETPHRIQGVTKKPYVWTFLDDTLVGYTFSDSRSSQAATRVLGTSKGTLVVDAYTGYNAVTTPEGRTRAGCLAHARRKFFAALATAPQARHALDLIRDIYVVEHDAREAGVARTEKHAAMRAARSAPVMAELMAYLESEQPKHLPKGPMGKAISYTLSNASALTVFLSDPRVSVDNNVSESALRTVALGRANYLFVGHKDAGDNLCTLLTLVRSAERCGINPLLYLTDVLTRVQTHPASDLDALLPDRWRPAVPS